MSSWYRARNVDAPWGDYGLVLVAGIASHPDESGRITILRTGPWVPPITVVGYRHDVIVTDALRRLIEEANLAGAGFLEVIKERIVRLDWRSWDLSAAHPAFYPPGGEPENYILGRKHNAALSEAIGPLWRLVAEAPGQIAATDFVEDPDGNGVIWSDRAFSVVIDLALDHVRFEPATLL